MTAEQLDALTSEHIALAHVRLIWRLADPGEMETVMLFFHLMHGRRTVLDVEALAMRRAEFEEQMDRAFASTGA